MQQAVPECISSHWPGKKTKPASLCPDSRAALKEILEEKAEPIRSNQTEGEC